MSSQQSEKCYQQKGSVRSEHVVQRAVQEFRLKTSYLYQQGALRNISLYLDVYDFECQCEILMSQTVRQSIPSGLLRPVPMTQWCARLNNLKMCTHICVDIWWFDEAGERLPRNGKGG